MNHINLINNFNYPISLWSHLSQQVKQNKYNIPEIN